MYQALELTAKIDTPLVWGSIEHTYSWLQGKVPHKRPALNAGGVPSTGVGGIKSSVTEVTNVTRILTI